MEEISEKRKKRTEELVQQGLACLEEEDFGGALEVAKELEELRYSAAFDIAAQAHAGMGDVEEAVRVLERGVKKVPHCGPNWKMLGDYRSDLGRFDEAAVAYEQALLCEGMREDLVRVNQAVLATRRGQYDEAIRIVDMITDEYLELPAARTRMTALIELQRFQEASKLAQQMLTNYPQSDTHGDELARIAAMLGRMRLHDGESRADVREFAFRALEHDASSPMLLALIRDIDAMYSEGAQYFRLLLHAEISKSHPLSQDAVGYLVRYDIVSDTPEEALQWVLEFEEFGYEDIDLLVEIQEVEALAPRPHDPKGVYWRSGRVFYTEEG